MTTAVKWKTSFFLAVGEDVLDLSLVLTLTADDEESSKWGGLSGSEPREARPRPRLEEEDDEGMGRDIVRAQLEEEDSFFGDLEVRVT